MKKLVSILVITILILGSLFATSFKVLDVEGKVFYGTSQNEVQVGDTLEDDVILNVRPQSKITLQPVDAIEKMGIPVICIVEESSLEGMSEMIEVIGKITQCDEKANKEAQKWGEKITELKAQAPNPEERTEGPPLASIQQGGQPYIRHYRTRRTQRHARDSTSA